MKHTDGAYTTLSVWLPKWVGEIVASRAETAGCDTQDLLGFMVLNYLQLGASISGLPTLKATLGAEIDEYEKIIAAPLTKIAFTP